MKIFVANTGRCGSAFFSEVFRTLTNIPSFHEPEPFCNGKVMEEVNTKVRYSKETKRILCEKIAQIEKDSKRGHYMESSQVFIKSYAELALESFDKVYCIYLYRNPIATLLSYVAKNRLSGASWDWTLQSQWAKNILQTEQKLDFPTTCFWQCLEVQERYYSLKKEFKKTYEFPFRDINDPVAWKKLFKHFRIKTKEFYELPEKLRKNCTYIDKAKLLDMVMDKKDSPDLSTKIRNIHSLEEHIRFARDFTEDGGF